MREDFLKRYEKFKERIDRRREAIHDSNDHVSHDEIKELMKYIDFGSTLIKLGIDARPSGKKEWRALCPDHVKYKGIPSSDPNWFINEETGLTYCFTEARGSTIVEVARNLWGLQTDREAFNKLKDGMTLPINLERGIYREEEEISDLEKLEEALDEVRPMLEACMLDDFAIEYFKRDGIEKLTLDKFGVISSSYGRYKNRVILPFFEENFKLVGYVAIDTLGRDRWAEERARYRQGIDSSIPYADLVEIFKKKYRKTLFAPGFQSRNHIYGLYENMSFLETMPKQVVIVEGERDCLKLMQENIPCLSVHGTSIKDEQVIKLKELGILSNLDEIYLGFDMDEAGDNAVKKAFDLLSTEVDSDKIYALYLPDDKITGEKRDPKKFNGEQIRYLMNYSKEKNLKTR